MAMKETTKTVFNFIKAHDGENIQTDYIAKELGLTSRQVTGSINSFVRHTKKDGEEKVADPLVYRDEVKVEGGVIKYIRLTESGRAFNPDEE